MNADLKKPTEIVLMQAGGQKLSAILAQLIEQTIVGTTPQAIEKLAYQLIVKAGGKPGFAMVPGYHWATCITVNDAVVHGIPTDKPLKSGDVVTIDIGMYYKGFHTDMSTSVEVLDPGALPNPETQRFLSTGQQALGAALACIKPGNRIGHISKAIQDTIEAAGYSCVEDLTGHGVGKQLHEYPPVPTILVRPIDQTPLLKEGMTLAIEVIYAQGGPQTYTDPKDGWTIFTQDGKIAAVYEKTIAVVGDGYLLITP